MLTGIRTGKYYRIMRWWSSKPQSGIPTVLDSVAYCCVRLPRLPRYSIPCLSYHTRSFDHPGVSCLHPIISAYRTRSFAHPSVSRLHPSIPYSLSASTLSSVFHCVTLSPCSLLIFGSLENPVKFSQSCFSVVSWHHHSSLLSPPPSYPFYPSHTSNIGLNATHCSTVAYRLPI